MNVQIVINTLQKKISDLTLTNVMLEAQIADLQAQLNTITEQNPNETALDGNENQTEEVEHSVSSSDDFDTP
tara:strand:+ start:1134 stop:1349 length:216 start_codon:yes stop_codon:yes gene_type:complete